MPRKHTPTNTRSQVKTICAIDLQPGDRLLYEYKETVYDVQDASNGNIRIKHHGDFGGIGGTTFYRPSDRLRIIKGPGYYNHPY